MQPHLLAFMVKEHRWAPRKGQAHSSWDSALGPALIQLLKAEQRQLPALAVKVTIC